MEQRLILLRAKRDAIIFFCFKLSRGLGGRFRSVVENRRGRRSGWFRQSICTSSEGLLSVRVLFLVVHGHPHQAISLLFTLTDLHTHLFSLPTNNEKIAPLSTSKRTEDKNNDDDSGKLRASNDKDTSSRSRQTETVSNRMMSFFPRLQQQDRRQVHNDNHRSSTSRDHDTKQDKKR